MSVRVWKDADPEGAPRLPSRPGGHVEPAPSEAIAFNLLPFGGCRWIFGLPGAEALACGKPRLLGRPWCAEHAARAFVGGKLRPVVPPPAEMAPVVPEAEAPPVRDGLP
jgi:hypothetical protein